MESATSKSLAPDSSFADIEALTLNAAGDPAAIDSLMAALHRQVERTAAAEALAEELQRRIAELEHHIRLLLHRSFGRRTEKLQSGQLTLFGEEATTESADSANADAGETQTITYTRQRSKGHGRGTFPPHIPRHDIPLDPDEAERVCDGCGNPLHCIRREPTERGHFIPGAWMVNRYLRGVWACKTGGCSVKMAELPPSVVDKSRFEPSVAVHAAVSKYGDHIPLERQSSMHERLGVHVPPTTLADSVQALADLHRGTQEQMEKETLVEGCLHSDDTPVVAILERKPKDDGTDVEAKKNSKARAVARFWVYVALSGKMFFRFTENRSRDGAGGPGDVLKDFRGFLIVDEYAGYDRICARPGVWRAGCWAHVRRKFREALLTHKKHSSHVLRLIGRLFRIEAAVKKRRAGRHFSDDELLALRCRRSKPLIERILAYARKIQPSVLPTSPLGVALVYLIENEAHLRTFFTHPIVPIDNNAAERAIRAVAVGRKNYLHIGSFAGGDAAAVLYSMIGTCKALGINPYAYLLDTTTRLLTCRDTPRAELTPWAWAAAQRQAHADLLREDESGSSIAATDTLS